MLKFIPFAKDRKRVETLFSQLNDRFMIIRNHTTNMTGLFARIIGIIRVLTFLQYVDYINGETIDRVKIYYKLIPPKGIIKIKNVYGRNL